MKFWIALSFLLICVQVSSAQATLTPLNPSVNEGTTQQFSVSGNVGTSPVWSCSGCVGTIDQTGLYHAPASVAAQASFAGYQFLPNNHIFNTNISGLSVHPNNSTWVATSRATNFINYLPGFPFNYTNSLTPTVSLIFENSAQNAAYQVQDFPQGEIEGGWLSARACDNGDHHYIRVATDTGNIQENYQYCPIGLIGACPTCNSVSGQKYTVHDYPLPNGATVGGTDAAGLFLAPLTLRLQEMEQAVATGGAIKHAIRVTMANGFICGTSGAGTCSPDQSAGTRHIWPATSEAFAGGGSIPYGARARLQASYPCSGGTGGVSSIIGTILCNQLQGYGIINADGGLNWQISISGEPWPANYVSAFNEMRNAGKISNITNVTANGTTATITASNDLTAGSTQVIVSATGSSNCGTMLNGTHPVASATGTQFTFSTAVNCTGGTDTGTILSPLTNYIEYVDESGLKLSNTSGETTNNRETVTYTDSNGSVSTDVVLNGVTINLPSNVMYFMAGTPAQQLTALVHGDPNTSVTWSMNPVLGTLTSGGLYTAPVSQLSPSSTTITATSVVNSSVAAQMTLWVFPANGIFVLPATTSDFTDSHGNFWKSGFSLGFNNLANWQGCCNTDGSFPMITDFQLFNTHLFSSFVAGDFRAQFFVPKGVYQITYNADSNWALGTKKVDLISQGVDLAKGIDFAAVNGGLNLPYTFKTIQSVQSDNKLSFYIFGSGGNLANGGGDVSSLSVVQIGSNTSGVSTRLP